MKYPFIKKSLKVVDTIKTRYVIIRYYFNGKPAHCMTWDKNFSSNLISQMEGTTLKNEDITKHWDLIPAYFILDSENTLQLTKSKIYDTDIKIMFDKITLVLRYVTMDDVNKIKLEGKSNIISNIRFITHFASQINIYKNKNILDPNKSWALHLILNEKQLTIKNEYINIYYKEVLKDKISILNLYQSLYLFFSKLNT